MVNQITTYDTAPLSESEEQFQRILKAANDKGIDFGMEMNVKKTKKIVISRKSKFQQSRSE